MVLTVAITALITTLLLFCALAALFFVAKQRLMAGLQSYFAPKGEDPSEFAELVSLITDQAASKNAQCLKSVFMGQNSVVSKNATKLDAALATDLASQQAPLLGMGLAMFPNLNKLVSKNPGALQMLATMLKGQGEKDGSVGISQQIELAGNGGLQEPNVFKF